MEKPLKFRNIVTLKSSDSEISLSIVGLTPKMRKSNSPSKLPLKCESSPKMWGIQKSMPPSSSPKSPLHREKLQNYDIINVIGNGAYGVVYSAKDKRTGKQTRVSCISK